MCHHFRKLFCENELKNFLIDKDAQHVWVVINREYTLSNGDECPKTLLFVEILEQVSHHKVHALAVADGRVSLNKSAQHISEGPDVFLHQVWGVVGESSTQVKLYLVETRVWVLHVMVTKDIVIIPIVVHIYQVGGPWWQKP